jgi:hypothetical protein
MMASLAEGMGDLRLCEIDQRLACVIDAGAAIDVAAVIEAPIAAVVLVMVVGDNVVGIVPPRVVVMAGTPSPISNGDIPYRKPNLAPTTKRSSGIAAGHISCGRSCE